MMLKFSLLLVGALVISSKSEPLRIEQQNFDSLNPRHDDSVYSLGSSYPSSDGVFSTVNDHGAIPTNSHRPVNSNYGSQNFPNYRSDQGPTSDLGNSDYHFQASEPSFGPVPQPGNHNYGSQGSFQDYRPNQETINVRKPYFGSQGNAPTYGSDYPRESLPGSQGSFDGSQASSPGFAFNQRPPTRPGNSYGFRGAVPGLTSNHGPMSGPNPYHSPQGDASTFGSNYPGESLPGSQSSHDDSRAFSPGFAFNQGPPTRPGNSYGSQGPVSGLTSNRGPMSRRNPYPYPQFDSSTYGSDYPRESLPGSQGSFDGSQASSPGFAFNQRPPTRPGNSYGFRGFVPGLTSNHGPMSGPNPYHSPQGDASIFESNYPEESLSGSQSSHDDSQASFPGFASNQGPLTRPGHSYGSQGPVPGFTSNQGPMNGRNPYHTPRDFSPSSGSDMGSDRNFPLVWQLETTEDIDRDSFVNNRNRLRDHLKSIDLWRLQPLQDNSYLYDLRRLPKVVFLYPNIIPDYSKGNGTLTINGYHMGYYSFRLVESPSIDAARTIYNPHNSEASIYITADPNWPIIFGFVDGKMRIMFHVRPVSF